MNLILDLKTNFRKSPFLFLVQFINFLKPWTRPHWMKSHPLLPKICDLPFQFLQQKPLSETSRNPHLPRFNDRLMTEPPSSTLWFQWVTESSKVIRAASCSSARHCWQRESNDGGNNLPPIPNKLAVGVLSKDDYFLLDPTLGARGTLKRVKRDVVFYFGGWRSNI